MGEQKVWTKNYSILTSSNMLYSSGFYMLMPTIPLFIVALGGTEAQVGLVATAFSVASILMRFFINIVFRKADKTRTFLAGMLLTVFIIAMYVWADSVGSIMVLRILQGFGFGIVSTLCAATVADILPESRKAEGIGYFGLGTILAAAVCPALGLYILSAYGFRAMFLVAAVFPLLAFIDGLFFKPPRGERNTTAVETRPFQVEMPCALLEEETGEQEEILPDIQPVAKKAAGFFDLESKLAFVLNRIFDRKLAMQAGLLVLLGISRSADMNFISVFASEQKIAFLSWYYIVQTGASFALRSFIGKLTDRKGYWWSIIPGGCAMLASLLILSVTHSSALLILAGLCGGLAFGAILPTMQTWMFNSVELKKSRLASATYYNSYDIGIGAGAVLLGYLVEISGFSLMFRVAAVFVVLFLVIYLGHIMKQRKTGSSHTINER